MYRTTVMLPEDLKSRCVREAQALGVSFGEFVREALATAADAAENPDTVDPLFADTAVYEGDTPTDVSGKHDAHLYEGGTS